MPKRSSQPRKTNGRGNRTTAVAVRRAIKRARVAPLARIRPNATLRGRGNASASITTNRKFIMVPKKLKADGKLGEKWWIEGLKWLGTVVMKILATALTAETVNSLLEQHPLPVGHPLTGKLLTGSVPTGAIIRLAFGAEDLVGDTDFITPDKSDKPAKGTGHYRQARIEWVRIMINPITSVKDKAGMIAAVIIPTTLIQVKDDLSVRKSEAHDFKELLRTPGVVFKTASTPTSVTYSPIPSHEAYNWSDFGSQSDTNPSSGMEIGGHVSFYLDIGYTNTANDSADMTSEYAMSAATLDITVESRVHLREFDEGVVTRIVPWTLTDSSKVTESSYRRSVSVPLDEIHVHHGVLLREATIDDIDM